jgi:4'-phosphopantetheinyl transferase
VSSGWLTRSLADVPRDNDWLGTRERAALAGLRFAKRREDWRLGRWTAKAVVAALLGVEPARIEVLAAADGAPEAWLDGAQTPLSVSLSHRAGLALAAVADAPAIVGCDLERLEPRSPAFVRDWLAPAEQVVVGGDAVVAPNLMWTAKEAAAKVRREGLRLDVRSAVTRIEGGRDIVGGWSPLVVEWAGETLCTRGWWRVDAGFVMTVAVAPDGPPPARL